jgi:hypothetical protein
MARAYIDTNDEEKQLNDKSTDEEKDEKDEEEAEEDEDEEEETSSDNPKVNVNALIEKYPAGGFNWWAFLLGPFYYAHHNLWKLAAITFLVDIIFLRITLLIPIGVAIWSGISHNKQYLESHRIYARKIK